MFCITTKETIQKYSLALIYRINMKESSVLVLSYVLHCYLGNKEMVINLVERYHNLFARVLYIFPYLFFLLCTWKALPATWILLVCFYNLCIPTPVLFIRFFFCMWLAKLKSLPSCCCDNMLNSVAIVCFSISLLQYTSDFNAELFESDS